MRKILVTGTSGFIGCTFVEAHRARYNIVGVDRVPPKERFGGVDYKICDLLDRVEVNRVVLEAEPEAIVHLAAKARVDDGVRDPIGVYRTNVEATVNLLETAAAAPSVKKFVYISSETVYGVVETYPTPEELGPGKPLSVYAASKAAADLMVQQFKGVNTVVARSAMGAGPRGNPAEQVVPRFIANVLAGKPMRFPAGNIVHPTRDVSPVWNFVQGIGLILDKKESSGVYNLGSGRELSILEVAQIVKDVLGRGKIEFDPAFQYRAGEVGYRTCLSIERARRELGFEPKVSLEECIRVTADWMQQHPTYWSERRVDAHDAWAGLQATTTVA